MNADVFKWGFMTIKWHVVQRKMKHLHNQDHNKNISNFLPSMYHFIFPLQTYLTPLKMLSTL